MNWIFPAIKKTRKSDRIKVVKPPLMKESLNPFAPVVVEIVMILVAKIVNSWRCVEYSWKVDYTNILNALRYRKNLFKRDSLKIEFGQKTVNCG